MEERGVEKVTSGFVQALWGDRHVLRRGKVLEDAAYACSLEHQPQPRVVYAYGKNNLKFLRSAGCKDALLANRHTVLRWGVNGGRNPTGRGGYNYGFSIWRHKLDAMLRAFELFDEIVWLDWDARFSGPVPDDFWDRLRERQPIQMPLTGYKRRMCWWRGRVGSHAVPEGAFVYCRERWIVEEADSLYPSHPHLDDQVLFSMVMDRMVGKTEPGQFTTDGYKEEGFEPYCVRIYRQYWLPDEQVVCVRRGKSHFGWQSRRDRIEAKKKKGAANAR